MPVIQPRQLLSGPLQVDWIELYAPSMGFSPPHLPPTNAPSLIGSAPSVQKEKKENLKNKV
jgi:hypothetical protein